MSCPHYLGEVVIYAGLALVAGAGRRTTAWLMLLWVVSGWLTTGGGMQGALAEPGDVPGSRVFSYCLLPFLAPPALARR